MLFMLIHQTKNQISSTNLKTDWWSFANLRNIDSAPVIASLNKNNLLNGQSINGTDYICLKGNNQ